MTSSVPTDSGIEPHPMSKSRLPEFIDWLLGALIAITGATFIIGGSSLELFIDREMLAEDIEEGTITVTVATAELTEAEMVEVADAIVSWTAIGLLTVGLGMVLFALGYIVVRHRAHRRARQGDSIRSYGSYAVLGALATSVLSFVPISPVFGGALAGYLERGESNRTISVGALAGILPMIPVLGLILFVLGGVISGMLAVGEDAIAMFFAGTIVLIILVLATVGAGLGAVGGYAGGRIAEHRAETRSNE